MSPTRNRAVCSWAAFMPTSACAIDSVRDADSVRAMRPTPKIGSPIHHILTRPQAQSLELASGAVAWR